MPGVNDTNGLVDNLRIPLLKSWTKNNTIEDALNAIRKEMETPAFKKLKQPDESALYP